MDFTIWDFLKIVSSVTAVALIWVYKRQIARLLESTLGSITRKDPPNEFEELMVKTEELFERILR